MLRIIAGQERWPNGDHIFSSSLGLHPWDNFGDHKRLLDEAMSERLGEFPPFVVHDLRRSVRTRLETLPGVPYAVAERVLAHHSAGPYRQYDFLSEKRAALEAWSAELMRIVGDAPGAARDEGREEKAA
jgi:integrase